MMTRTSRLLKWIGAGTVLLAAAPIAYADGARHTGSPSSASASPGGGPAARCGAEPSDYAGTYTVAGHGDVEIDLRADGGMSELVSGAPAATGTWRADGAELVWTAGGVTYTAVAACGDPAHAARVTAITATPVNGSAGSAAPLSPFGVEGLTLQRF